MLNHDLKSHSHTSRRDLKPSGITWEQTLMRKVLVQVNLSRLTHLLGKSPCSLWHHSCQPSNVSIKHCHQKDWPPRRKCLSVEMQGNYSVWSPFTLTTFSLLTLRVVYKCVCFSSIVSQCQSLSHFFFALSSSWVLSSTFWVLMVTGLMFHGVIEP